MKNIPQRIWLMLDEDNARPNDFNQLDTEDVYWSTHRNSEKDIEFVSREQADNLADALRRTLEMSNKWGKEWFNAATWQQLESDRLLLTEYDKSKS